MIIELEINKFHVILVVLYGPNTDCPHLYDNIKDLLLAKENLPLIICRDWNLVMDPNLDTLGYIWENNAKPKCEVLEMIYILDLMYTWRCFNPTLKNYTWTNTKMSSENVQT